MDNSSVRFISIEIKNFKNIKQGFIELDKKGKDNSKTFRSNIIGIYGQNGSGKTSVIQVLEIFQRLVKGEKLREDINNLINVKEDDFSFEIKFDITADEYKYRILYSATISKIISNLSYEKLAISKLEKDGKWTKMLPYFECKFDDNIRVFSPQYRYKNVVDGLKENKITLALAYKLAQTNHTSLLFSSELYDVLKTSNEKELFLVIDILKNYALNKLFIISASYNSINESNIRFPLTVCNSDKESRIVGDITISLDKPMVTSLKEFELIKNTINSMNGVINEIVPGLSFSIKDYGEQLLKDNTIGKRYEIMSNRYDESFAIRYESEGIKRLFSELSVLIAAYNNPSILVAIDDLDNAIFESLLGTMINVMRETGKGQLIFTSHNLRPLEVLDKDQIIFTTTNEYNRFIRFTNIRESNNFRDCYIRALTLGGQREELSTQLKESSLQHALRHAVDSN